MNVHFAYKLYLRIFFGGYAPTKGNPFLCQLVFDRRQCRVDLMCGFVCFYLPCKDVCALGDSVVSFTPAIFCQKKKDQTCC